MKILPPDGVNIRNLYGQQIQGVQTDANAVREQQRAAEYDRVDISADAKDIENAREFAKDLPDVRMDRIAEIKEQVAAGTYRVDSRDIAERVLQQAVGLPA